MQKIPVSFDYNGKHYQGILSQVSGGGTDVWHLMIDNYYYGMLIYTDKWVFHNNKKQMKELADFFGEQVSKLRDYR